MSSPSSSPSSPRAPAPAAEVLVEFHDSGLYGYRPVPPAVYAEFELADSKGTFLNAVIKPGYPARKLRGRLPP